MLASEFKVKAIKPSEQEFHDLVKEFWFEAYHVAIYLKREDLWSVKFRSWATHTFLLRMIEWHAQARNNWHAITPPNGKRMPSWVSKDIWRDLHAVFAHFELEDSYKALFKTMELFKKLTMDTAQMLGYNNQENLSENMRNFITNLKTTPKS